MGAPPAGACPLPEDIHLLSATETARRIRAGELTAVDAVEASLARIDERNGELNAFVLRLDEKARAAAIAADQAAAAGARLGPLHGVPVAVKDLFDPLEGERNTLGCRVFADHVADANATYIQRLLDAGAIIVGKTNTPEFGHKGVTDNLLFGPTCNPFDLTRNTGGSSGGSAAAVADALVPLAQGSDAGGSIRIPAAHCGVVGFKPTYGRVASAYRPDGFLHTPFVHAGPITRSVADAALMASVMCGPDPSDPLCLPDDGVDWLAAAARPVGDVRAAWSPDLGDFPVASDVAAVCGAAVTALADRGIDVDPIALQLGAPHEQLTQLWLDQMAVLYAATAQNLKAVGVDLLGEHRGALCPEFIDLLERGAAMGAVEAKGFDVLRTTVFDAVQDALTEHDVLVCPTLSVPPFPNADDGSTLGPAAVEGRPVERTIGWCMTHPFNFTGHPAISIPAGLDPQGLPIGLQIVGRRFEDATVLAVAAALEAERPWLNDLPAFAARS